MSAPPVAWDATALQHSLRPLLPGLQVEVAASLPSSNSELLARARAGAEVPPCLLVVEQQTAGRGRNGRPWQSAPGASLTFSLALPLQPADWSGLSLAVGVALAEALDPVPPARPPRLLLKWPNDLWLGEGPGRGRKLGGILIETLAGGGRRTVVVGVGINVLPQPLQGLDTGFASLNELDPATTAAAALHTLAVPLLRSVLRFEHEGLTPFAEAFARRDLLRGVPVGTGSPQALQGVAEGIDAHGALLVRCQGVQHAIVGGEVSVRPLDHQEPLSC